jgi:hypothetical protein
LNPTQATGIQRMCYGVHAAARTAGAQQDLGLHSGLGCISEGGAAMAGFACLTDGRIALSARDGPAFEGLVGLVQFADGTTSCSSEWELGDCRESHGQDGAGKFIETLATFAAAQNLSVEVSYRLYAEGGIIVHRMQVTNVGGRDVRLSRLGALLCTPPKGRFDAGFVEPTDCRIFDQVFYWTGHREPHDYLRLLAGRQCSYWGAMVADSSGRALYTGICGPAKGVTEIWLSRESDGLGFELGSSLYTSLDRQRPLRLPPQSSHGFEPIAILAGSDPWQTMVDYAEFVCRRLDWHPRHPPYAGLFAAYGSDPENGDPEKTPLTEGRIEDLVAVVDRYLKPYGLDTIKTQFRGLSSSGFTDRVEAGPTLEESGAALIGAIRRKGWSGEGIKEDFPHGIPWHVQRLVSKGYRPALVCRPFLNIKGGTPELDKVAADLFEMTVKEWGYRYIMFDFNSVDYQSDTDTLTVEEGIYNRFKAVRDRLGAAVFIEACMVWPGPVIGVADGFRPGHDWRGGLEFELMQIFAARYHYHGRLFQLDNEFFDPALRPFTWGTQGVEGMQGSLERVRMWASFCAVLGMSNLTGAALEKVSPERWRLFQRALPVISGQAIPVDFMRSDPPRRWTREVAAPDGRFWVLALFNYQLNAASAEVVRPPEWGLHKAPAYLFYDFWSEQLYGPAAEVPLLQNPFSCHVLFVQPVPDKPRVVGSTRHITGQCCLEKWECDERAGLLQGVFVGAPGSQERYYIWVPSGDGVLSCTGADFEIERPHLVRLTVHFGASGRKPWELRLSKGNMPVL